FRPNPPLNGVRWCIRNNLNYQQSALLLSLNYMARNGRRYLDNFYRKSLRAVERGRTADGPHAFHIPADQPRAVEAGNLVNLLRFHGIEVHTAERAFKAGGVDVAAGDYVVRLDQPYGPLARTYFGVQMYRASDPRPYDDTGWTLHLLRNVALHEVKDTAVLRQPLRLVTQDVTVRGELVGGRGARAYLIAPTTESGLIQFRFALRDVEMFAAEDSFTLDRVTYAAGAVIIPATDARSPVHDRIRQAAESLGIRVTGAARMPQVAQHPLDLPRIALVHSWLNTQNEGWVRFAFDRLGIPVRYLNVQQLADRQLLSGFDVLVFPYVGSNPQLLVSGQPMAGPKIPWRRTPETPNIGVMDSTDDIRPGIGLAGMAVLRDWIAAGGLFVTEGATSAVMTDYGVTRFVNIEPARQLRASGGVYRSVLRDRRSPIAYGYADTLAVYFNQSPLFQAQTGDTPQEQPDEDADTVAARQLAEMRPRVVFAFHAKEDSLRLSGLLVNGEELAGRPAVIDAPVGRGHVVLFAIRPFWRWETQGSFALAFNAILNWNDLHVGRPARQRRPTATVDGDQGPIH
ncbi:MAG: M14 family zinc carboxypeptidase, partial [Gemmatimonadales bacterium]